MEKFVHGKSNEYIDWLDVDGNVINVSDGGMIYADGKYHWYGLALGEGPSAPGGKGGDVTHVGVTMYASEDLLNWEYEGVILGVSDDPNHDLYAPMRFERPKIVYNEKTKKYVLWCHYVGYPGELGADVGTSDAGVAVSDNVAGPYEWLGFFRPIDDLGAVKDCTLYKDRDGTAYFIYDRRLAADNRCIHVMKLSDDYLTCTGEYKMVEPAFRREAPSILYHDGYYFMITSDTTGWEANRAKYFRAKELMGEWEDMGDPCIDDLAGDTFHTQPTYIFKVEGKENMFILMSERHNQESFLHCSYVWWPIELHDDHTLSLPYHEEWTL